MAGLNGRTMAAKRRTKVIESKGGEKFMKKALIVGIDNYSQV